MGIPAAFPIATPSLLIVVVARPWLRSLFWKLLIRLVLSRIILVLGHFPATIVVGHFPATIVVLMMVLLGPLALSHGHGSVGSLGLKSWACGHNNFDADSVEDDTGHESFHCNHGNLGGNPCQKIGRLN